MNESCLFEWAYILRHLRLFLKKIASWQKFDANKIKKEEIQGQVYDTSDTAVL